MKFVERESDVTLRRYQRRNKYNASLKISFFEFNVNLFHGFVSSSSTPLSVSPFSTHRLKVHFCFRPMTNLHSLIPFRN